MEFIPHLTVASGDNEIGSSPYGTVSVMAVSAAGTVGVFVGSTFHPHPDGALAAGEMLTFEVGKGRRIGFNATTAGTVSTTEV